MAKALNVAEFRSDRIEDLRQCMRSYGALDELQVEIINVASFLISNVLPHLQLFGDCFISGGSISALMRKQILPLHQYADFDLFFRSQSEFDRFEKHLRSIGFQATHDSATSLKLSNQSLKFDLVKLFSLSAMDVINDFDMIHCMGAFWVENGVLENFTCHHDYWFANDGRKILFHSLDETKFPDPDVAMQRVAKYMSRGFQIGPQESLTLVNFYAKCMKDPAKAARKHSRANGYGNLKSQVQIMAAHLGVPPPPPPLPASASKYIGFDGASSSPGSLAEKLKARTAPRDFCDKCQKDAQWINIVLCCPSCNKRFV